MQTVFRSPQSFKDTKLQPTFLLGNGRASLQENKLSNNPEIIRWLAKRTKKNSEGVPTSLFESNEGVISSSAPSSTERGKKNVGGGSCARKEYAMTKHQIARDE